MKSIAYSILASTSFVLSSIDKSGYGAASYAVMSLFFTLLVLFREEKQ
jgi:hypothetical protein